ncbi:methyl-accepting chemotaxis protein [Rheinheimera muenzenbergensis]|uniref:Methyl-accepting chemotaxis protein n=1 Tax=Rheinheimera muenzenbergensis TaxID=1193628 RepID=A0ABU8C1G7_9GAMM
MRNNQPLTRVEHQLDPKRPLVSVTNLAGEIVHANASFIQISGFSRAELLGQPHNIIRHPDMPAEAFADMWRTLKADLPWRGLVKNRCKNGDYYWVDAYATPTFERGQKTGYMSVRRRPEPQQVAQAEALYAAVRSKQAAFAATRYQRDMPFKTRLLLLVMVPVLCFGAELFAVDSWRWVVSLAGVVSAAGLGLWTYLGIVTPLQRLGAAMNRISAGDLSAELDTRAAAEFAAILIGFQSMSVNLRAMIADMVVIGGDIDTQCGGLNAQVELATERSRQGAENICTMAAAVEQLSASVSDIAQFTRHSAAQATAAAQQVEQGVEQIVTTLQVSTGVVARMDGAQALITELDKEIVSIRQLAQSIREIADQTNLLALNAAIEAARAGESGRGFAVVADEVRNLASRTSGSTVEITATVERIGTCTANTLHAIAIAAQEVQHSNAMMEQNQRSYQLIKRSADDIQDSSRDIADMLQQQEVAATEVAGNIEQISKLMDQNSRSIGTISTASAQLSDTAHQLQQMTSRFENSL